MVLSFPYQLKQYLFDEVHINSLFFRTILELVKRREKSKKEMLQLTIEVVEKR